MKLIDCKKQIIDIFKKSNIDLQQVNILFCEVLNCSTAELLTRTELTSKEYKKIMSAVKKRLDGMPIQKIFKRAYFFGLTFKVDKNVLCPRPETELLVEETLKHTNQNDYVLDLCTGSGAIAVALAKNSTASVFASDISQKA
ncbi:MAG: peptide chain release factor N(5)-glutamine methyltransferase, partial [Christensenellales bacterium]